MTVRLRASVIPGLLALSALALTACSSQGTIGAGASGGGPVPGPATSSASAASSTASSPANPSASTGGTSAPSSVSTGSSAPPNPVSSSHSAPSTQDPSALASSFKTLDQLWKDQGCKTALGGFSDYVLAEQKGDLQGVAAIPGAVQKIHVGAQQTRKPGAALEMNKMATDMQAMFTQAQHGQTPNKGPVSNDFQIMGNICSTGNM